MRELIHERPEMVLLLLDSTVLPELIGVSPHKSANDGTDGAYSARGSYAI